MNILGLNAYHGDVSAVLVRDGRLVAAVEEERFRRIKHIAGFPSLAIAECLRMGGITRRGRRPVRCLAQSSRAPVAQGPVPAAEPPEADDRRPPAQPGEHSDAAGDDCGVGRPRRVRGPSTHAVRRASSRAPGQRGASSVRSTTPRSARLTASAISSARRGDASADRPLHVDGRVFFPHSLGLLYLAITQYLGFPKYGDEFKVMGLAPYGEPRYVREIESLVNLRDDGHVRARSLVLQPLVRRRPDDLGGRRTDASARLHPKLETAARAGAADGTNRCSPNTRPSRRRCRWRSSARRSTCSTTCTRSRRTRACASPAAAR